ncbi:MAG TPA: roadblock/LC7 domain-containing protein [bacterium]|jgi:predicted regulator of Ras-like GTPase activity (Roadblock/LC7/MglB family)|nr:roadblock/LC7 domain-containing protein [bacterium]
MDFKKILEEMLENVEGAIGSSLVGMDGIVIDQVARNQAFDINAVGAEYSSIIKNAMRASSNFGLGNTAEILITTDKATMIMMLVGKSYFVALALNLDGNLGRGRLELKKAIPKFEKELS